MAEPVRVRRLSDPEGQKLQRLVRRGTGSAVRLRRAMVVLASAGNSVPVIARLVQADEDSVRGVIHRFNEMGMPSLDPQWAGGRPRQISSDDEQFIVSAANHPPVETRAAVHPVEYPQTRRLPRAELPPGVWTPGYAAISCSVVVWKVRS